MLVQGGLLWVEDSLEKLSDEEIHEFKEFLIDRLPNMKICESENVKFNSLKIEFKVVFADDLFLERCDRDFDIFRVIVNDMDINFYIREYIDNYAKTIVNEIIEYSPSALKSFTCFATHNEWESEYLVLEEHFKYRIQ